MDETLEPQHGSQDDPAEALARIRAAAALAKIRAAKTAPGMTDLLKEGGLLPGADAATRRHFNYRSGELALRNEEKHAADVASDEDAAQADLTPWVKGLGTVASLARDVPGGEFLQTGARSIFRGEPQAEAFGDIRRAEDAAPAAARNLARLTGGTIAALSLPKILPKAGTSAGVGNSLINNANYLKPLTNVVAQGGQFAALNQALQADPSKGIKERGDEAIASGGAGILAGKVLEPLTNALRVGSAPTLGTSTEARETARKQAADPLYDAFRAEARAGGGTSPGVRQAANFPLIKPFVQSIRSSNLLQGKPTDDASVLAQAYKEMSENERGFIARIDASAAARPLTEREKGDVAALKGIISNAFTSPSQLRRGTPIVPPLGPSFGPANQVYAQHSGDLEAMQDASDAAKRVMHRTSIAGANQGKESPEAFLTALKGQQPEQARASTQGILGRAKQEVGPSKNPLTVFGAGSSLARISRLSPFLQAADEKTGGDQMANFLRALGIATAGRD